MRVYKNWDKNRDSYQARMVDAISFDTVLHTQMNDDVEDANENNVPGAYFFE